MTQLDDQQLNEIRSALKHSKIEAVKIYKGLTGESLAASKAFVESLGASNHAGGNGMAPDQMDEVLDELSKGNKLAAIKLYRSASGSTLKQSKEFIENLAAELKLDLPNSQGCGAAMLLFATASSAIAFGLLA